MRIPLSWLRQYTQLPAEATAESLMADLVKVGLEEEDVHRFELTGPIVVGKVLEKTPEEHSNGKTINWCQVQVVPDGQTQVLQGDGIDPSGVQGVVCGAHNFKVGDKVIVTLPGAILPGNFHIAARKTYGHTSAGMIASEAELGLGAGHDGIVVLSEWGLDPEPGTNVLSLLHLDDEAAEINVTPDRGYVLSMRGVAREYSHATGTVFSDPAEAIEPPAANSEGWPVRIEDTAPIHGNSGATRFIARRVYDINPQAKTPLWMSARLRLAGIRPVSLAVDITNYVMLELGQPLHCYDAEKLHGDIVVRRAYADETLETLDGKTRTLHPEDLLITDDSGPIGLAGVMGGLATEVGEATTEILIEAANFDPVSISRSQRRHRLPSEASKRNARGVDWAIADKAAQRVAELLAEYAGGTIDAGVTDVGEQPASPTIRLRADYPSNLIGHDYTEDQINQVLVELGAHVSQQRDDTDGTTIFVVIPPSWRTDLAIPEDLVEEVARLIGYSHIPSTLPVPPPGRGLTAAQRLRRQVSNALAGAGLVETLSYPFVSEQRNKLFGSVDEHTAATQSMVKLANPISAEFGWLRTTILPGLLETLHRNVSRGFRDVALFESGLVFLPGERIGSPQIPPLGIRPSATVLADIETGIPAQPHRLAAVFAGHVSQPGPGHTPRMFDWQDPIGIALDMADVVGAELEVRQGSHQAFHPGRTAELVLEDQIIGYAGELLPKLLEDLDLPQRTAALELDLDALVAAAPSVVEATPVAAYPATYQDVALVVDNDIAASSVQHTLQKAAGALLEHIGLFDVYAGQGIAEGKKSLAFNLRFRAPDRTLTADEASQARLAAISAAEAEFGAVLR
ncbi:MAG TPA: phenylalanine--tRNA ligase subunit beta [Candidatus Yaniella excrementigallinarum]|nr:phenylalanine--tRNA ligase subunit beta [Candidatus Yaniella excrementigallinarum]